MHRSTQVPGPHPSVERLRDFVQGRAPLEEIAAIEAHLMGCRPCCAALEELPDDPLLSLIRTVGRSTERGAANANTAAGVNALSESQAARPRVQGYELLEELGRGGMGVVYKARQVGLGRTVALKMLLVGAHADVALLARFRAEGEAVARLNHPNVVQVYDTGTSDGLPYFALEYVEDGSLADHLRGTPHPPGAAASFLELLARATAAAHRAGIVHRDLKPANVLLARESQGERGEELADFIPKIADFGLAKWAEQGDGLTRTGTLVGTPAYMSPEQAAGSQSSVGPATDVYSLGAILYELLTGRPPFQGSTSLDTLDQVRYSEPVPPRQLVPRLPRDVETICLKCLDKDPKRRFASADALGDDLARFQRGEPILARPVGAPVRVGKWVRRHPSLAILLTLTAAALLGGTGVSSYFAIAAGRRASDARSAEGMALALASERQEALLAAEQAQRESLRRSAELLFREGAAQCESGAVARGLYTLLDAWQAAPQQDVEFRRVVRTNLAAWRWHLPRLRGIAAYSLTGRSRPFVHDGGATFAIWSNEGVQNWNVDPVTAAGPPIAHRKNELIRHPFPEGTLLCTAGGKSYTRRPDGSPEEDVPLPEWVNGLGDFAIEQRGLGRTDRLIQGPTQDRFFRIWPLRPEKKDPILIPCEGGMTFRIVRDRAGHDVFVAFRRYPAGIGEELEFWNLNTGTRVSGFEPGGRGDDPAVSWDGGQLAMVSAVRSFAQFGPAGHDGSVRWWNPATGQPLGPLWQPRGAAWFSELGSDHATLASWCRDMRMRLYDLGTGLQRGGELRINLDLYDDGWAPTFTLSPDCGTLFAGDRQREVHVWDIRHLRLQSSTASNSRLPPSRTTGTGLQFSSSAAFSPNRATALICPEPKSHFGVLVDGHTNLPLGRPLSHELVFYPVFSPDGRLAGTLTYNNNFGGEEIARVWNVATGEPHTPPLRNPRYLHCAAFSPNGKVLALGNTGGAHLWDVESARLLRALPESSTACRLRFSPDGTRLAAGFRGGWPGFGAGFRLWDPLSGEPVGDFIKTWAAVLQLAFAEQGRTVLALAAGRQLWAIDATTGRPRNRPLILAGGGPAAIDPDRLQVATTDHGGSVRQWDARTGAQIGGPMAHPARIVSIHYAPEGKLLATVCEDESVRLWDTQTSLPLGPPLVHRSAVLAAAFDADGRWLRTATASRRVVSWPVPEPIIDDAQRFDLWIEATLGMQRKQDEVILLGAEPWQKAVDEMASRWPVPDPALAVPEDASFWHAVRADEAEEEGNVAAALFHHDRLIDHQPEAWSYHARRGRALCDAADLEPAEEAYERAQKKGVAEVQNWYRRQIAILGARGQHDGIVNWYEELLHRLEAPSN